MDNPLAWLFGAIVLIKLFHFLFGGRPGAGEHDDSSRLLEEELDDSPTYLNDPLGDPRPQGGPMYD